MAGSVCVLRVCQQRHSRRHSCFLHRYRGTQHCGRDVDREDRNQTGVLPSSPLPQPSPAGRRSMLVSSVMMTSPLSKPDNWSRSTVLEKILPAGLRRGLAQRGQPVGCRRQPSPPASPARAHPRPRPRPARCHQHQSAPPGRPPNCASRRAGRRPAPGRPCWE